jgi:hypothetical protein
MIKPKTGDLQIEATRFHSLVDTYNNDFANGGKIACFQVLFLSFPCLRISFSMFQTLTTASFASPISLISYLFYFFGTIFDVEAIPSDLSPIHIFFYHCQERNLL